MTTYDRMMTKATKLAQMIFAKNIMLRRKPLRDVNLGSLMNDLALASKSKGANGVSDEDIQKIEPVIPELTQWG